jgi:DNA-directed RNA polymerase subunit alpha
MELNYQRPRILEVEELTENYGKFVAEPFERGYGSTIGIALRRVLLSLVEGYAITAIRIDGVLHEFSLIPGVYEDVLNIILNLKSIPFKLEDVDTKIVKIEKNGKGEILSGDIISDGDVEILDKTIHIAHLEDNASFNAEIVLKKGVGYKLAEQNFDEELPIDFIPVDSNFSPIEKVKYSIQPARVGKKTDYEKLIVEVWTDGSIAPRETVSIAGKILRDHLAIYLNYQDTDIIVPSIEQNSEFSIESKSELLEKNVEAMGLSVRALKCLKRLGVGHIFELIEKTEHELLNSKNFGKKSLEEIIMKLRGLELSLGQKLPETLRETMLAKLAVINTEESEEN